MKSIHFQYDVTVLYNLISLSSYLITVVVVIIVLIGGRCTLTIEATAQRILR